MGPKEQPVQGDDHSPHLPAMLLLQQPRMLLAFAARHPVGSACCLGCCAQTGLLQEVDTVVTLGRGVYLSRAPGGSNPSPRLLLPGAAQGTLALVGGITA